MKVIRNIVGSLLVLACATLAPAQDVTQPTGTAQPVVAQYSDIYAAGVSFNTGASTPVAGTALYAHAINASGTYAFSVIDALPASTKPFVVATNVAIGAAQKIATLGNFPILVPTAAGISWTGQNTGWAWSTGAATIYKPNPAKNFFIMPTVRVLKSSVSGGTGYQPIVGVEFGFGKSAVQ